MNSDISKRIYYSQKGDIGFWGKKKVIARARVFKLFQNFLGSNESFAEKIENSNVGFGHMILVLLYSEGFKGKELGNNVIYASLVVLL